MSQSVVKLVISRELHEMLIKVACLSFQNTTPQNINLHDDLRLGFFV